MQSHGVDWREYVSSGSTESLFSLCGGREARCQNLKIAPSPMAPPVASHVFGEAKSQIHPARKSSRCFSRYAVRSTEYLGYQKCSVRSTPHQY